MIVVIGFYFGRFFKMVCVWELFIIVIIFLGRVCMMLNLVILSCFVIVVGNKVGCCLSSWVICCCNDFIVFFSLVMFMWYVVVDICMNE